MNKREVFRTPGVRRIPKSAKHFPGGASFAGEQGLAALGAWLTKMQIDDIDARNSHDKRCPYTPKGQDKNADVGRCIYADRHWVRGDANHKWYSPSDLADLRREYRRDSRIARGK